LSLVQSIRCPFYETKGKDVGVNWQPTLELVMRTYQSLDASISYLSWASFQYITVPKMFPVKVIDLNEMYILVLIMV
jgi:hypothetical protein